jgi:hypothetical protein
LFFSNQRVVSRKAEWQKREINILTNSIIYGIFRIVSKEVKNLMDYKAFADKIKNKSFDEIVHEGKQKAQKLLEAQGITAVALYISEMMAKSIELSRSSLMKKGTN